MNACIAVMLLLLGQSAPNSQPEPLDGYSGIYAPRVAATATQPGGAGGIPTSSPRDLAPAAVYVASCRKTLFAYVATNGPSHGSGGGRVKLVAGCFDHESGTVRRPSIVATLTDSDAHVQPGMVVDRDGYLWLFISASAAKPGRVYKSDRPCDVTSFSSVGEHDWLSPQPWYLEGRGFLVVHTGPKDGLYLSRSTDGRSWDPAKVLVASPIGGFISGNQHAKLGIAFTSPAEAGLRASRQLCYIETADGGRNWSTAFGKSIAAPLNAADDRGTLVFDYGAINREASLQDLTFDTAGNAAILYLLGFPNREGRPGSQTWTVARAFGRAWIISGLITSDHPRDSGALYLERPGTWSLIGSTADGPQPGAPGGDIILWSSFDAGRSWNSQLLTRAARSNHVGVGRPLGAQADFYALWSDGGNPSRLYFAAQDGRVFILPARMAGKSAKPELVPLPPPASGPSTAPSSTTKPATTARAVPTTRPRGRHVPPPRRGAPGPERPVPRSAPSR